MKKSKHNMPTKDRFERFFCVCNPDECWPWLGSVNRKGYGNFRVGSLIDKAHRVAYRLGHGDIPAGLEILHSCDNASCVNPRHLSVGTTLENQREAWQRDKKKNVRKLSPEQIIEIRASEERQPALARRFGVHQSEISRIRNHKRGNAIMLMRAPIAVGG